MVIVRKFELSELKLGLAIRQPVHLPVFDPTLKLDKCSKMFECYEPEKERERQKSYSPLVKKSLPLHRQIM